MKNIRAIIVDDEANAIRNLKWEIEQFCSDVEIIDTFINPTEAISAINYLKPDCVFLDIEMPEIDGFQLLKKLHYRDFDLIITTAFDNYAIRAFKENAIDYLLKPIDSDDLQRSVERIQKNKEKNTLGFKLTSVLESITPKPIQTRIALPLSGKIVFLEPKDILYCKSNGNYTEVYFENNTKEVLSRKLKDVEEIIDNTSFFRVHHSYLVNINHIKEFVKSDGKYLVLNNKATIPISRMKKDALLNLLNI
jgi:two-component system LytT family response regulator